MLEVPSGVHDVVTCQLCCASSASPQQKELCVRHVHVPGRTKTRHRFALQGILLLATPYRITRSYRRNQLDATLLLPCVNSLTRNCNCFLLLMRFLHLILLGVILALCLL
jgi:hypothetical protein